MSKDHATYKAMALTVTGVLLIGFALLVEDSAIERALVSDPSRTLSWGPMLFRLLLAIHGIALVLTARAWRKRSLVAMQTAAQSGSSQPSPFQTTSRTAWLVL